MTMQPEEGESLEHLLLLADYTGAMYAIPKDFAEAHRATKEMLDDVRKQLAEQRETADVRGFSLYNSQAQSFIAQTTPFQLGDLATTETPGATAWGSCGPNCYRTTRRSCVCFG